MKTGPMLLLCACSALAGTSSSPSLVSVPHAGLLLASRLGRSPLLLRGGSEPNSAADAMADTMADTMADAMADKITEGGDDDESASENPLRDLIDEGCTAWDDEQDADRAEKAFQQALALDPTSPDALCSMAVLLHESGRDLNRAAEHFAKALESSPEHVDTLHFYGNLLYSQQNDAAAELMYKRAVQVIEDSMPADPEDVHPLYIDTLCNHGALLERVRHDIDGAQALYEKALKFDQNHRSVLFNYGVLLEDARKDYAAAEAMYRRALDQVLVLLSFCQPKSASLRVIKWRPGQQQLVLLFGGRNVLRGRECCEKQIRE